MTQTTDQERAEFEEIMRDSPSYKPALLNWVGERYEFDIMESAWQGFQLGKQAARRAPVVPQGWKITEEMHVAAVKVLHRASGVDGLPQRMVDAMLAAAPQPPEAAQLDDTNVVDMAQAVDSKEEAPVQLPEPVAYQWLETDNFRLSGGPVSGSYWRKLYTDQQVSTILAQHGIKTK